MSKQITEAIKTAKKIAVFELEKIMYNIIIDNAGRVDVLKLEHGNIYAYLRGTKLAPEDVKKLGGIKKVVGLYEKYKIPLSLKQVSITVHKKMDGIW